MSSIGLSTSFQKDPRESNSAKTFCPSGVKNHLECLKGPSWALGFSSSLLITCLSQPHSTCGKYVDDTSETIPKGQQSKAQDLVDIIHEWSKTNPFEINCDKTKELNISFSHQRPLFPRACIDGNSMESVQCHLEY